MKKIIFLFLVSIFAVSGFAQSKKNARIVSNEMENGISSSVSKTYKYSLPDAGDPQYSIPGTMGWWDYITNGSNMQNIAVFGDTIIISYPYTTQENPTGTEARVAYYLVSYNGGATWESPLPLTTLPIRSGYPEVQSFIFGGSRALTLNGRKYNGTNSRGAAWKDAFLGLGSFESSFAPTEGRDFFGQYMGNGLIGGLFNIPNGTTNPIFDTLFFSKYNFSTNTFSTRLKIAEPSLAQIGGNSRYNFAVDASGNNCLAMWYKDSSAGSTATSFTKMMLSTSSNGGTTWTTPTIIQASRGINSIIAPGDTCSPWFGIDALYKPGTTNYGIAWSTLGPGANDVGNNTASNGSCKIFFYSPGINGGVPVVVAGKENMQIISDTSLFNNRQTLQVGVLPVSHPSLAWSADGTRLVCAFSAFQPGDSLYGYTYNDIYVTYSDNGGLTWAAPQNLTNTRTEDELYPTLSLTSNTATRFHIHYQQTHNPGCQSFSDTTRFVSEVYQMYRTFNPQNVGVQTVSTTIPEKYSLKQNYPNPFNPTTSIRFDVVKASKMTLKVYDLSGKLVQTLVNDELLTPGTKEVVFDAGKLSSGVYFYTLTSDNFRETKKMMLIK